MTLVPIALTEHQDCDQIRGTLADKASSIPLNH
jgi:hypothetical protein